MTLLSDVAGIGNLGLAGIPTTILGTTVAIPVATTMASAVVSGTLGAGASTLGATTVTTLGATGRVTVSSGDLQFSGSTNPALLGDDADGVFTIANNAVSTGPWLKLYGTTEATNPYDFALGYNSTDVIRYDDSAALTTISTALNVTGATTVTTLGTTGQVTLNAAIAAEVNVDGLVSAGAAGYLKWSDDGAAQIAYVGFGGAPDRFDIIPSAGKDLYLGGDSITVAGTLGVTGATTLGQYLSVTGNAAAATSGLGNIGANSTNGLQLIGNGSTYDVYLGNRGGTVGIAQIANSDNMIIPTGDLSIGGTLGVTGAVTLSAGLTLPTGNLILLDGPSGNDYIYSIGDSVLMVAGGTLGLTVSATATTVAGTLGVTGLSAFSQDMYLVKSAPTNAATFFITNTGNSSGDKMDIDFTSGSQLRGRIRNTVIGSPFYGQTEFYTALGASEVLQMTLGSASGVASANFAGTLSVTGATSLNLPTAPGASGTLWNDSGTVKVA